MKNKKNLILVLVSLIFSSVTFAETLDEEIQRLKKENELLELQKKNEELKSGKGFESKKSVNVDKSGAFGFCKGEYASTGCFIGAEVGIASDVINSMTGEDSLHFVYGKQSTYAIPVNLIFGWQWYLSESMGLNFKAHIGYAGYGSDLTFGGIASKFKSSAIHYGLEVSYLYDFLATTKHRFGADVGIGYELGTFVLQEFDRLALDSYTASSFTSRYGVHYFLNTNHQFWLHYVRKSGYPIGKGGAMTEDVSGDVVTLKYSTTPNSSIVFAYAYKF